MILNENKTPNEVLVIFWWKRFMETVLNKYNCIRKIDFNVFLSIAG